MDKNLFPPCPHCRYEVDLVNMADETPTRSTRFPRGLDDRFTNYRDERDMTNSEALRSLVRTGLEEETADESDAGGAGGGGARGLLGSLLTGARQSRGTHLGIGMILLFLHFGLSLSPTVDYLLLAVTGAYALSAVFGYVEVVRARYDPEPAAPGGRADTDDVEA